MHGRRVGSCLIALNEGDGMKQHEAGPLEYIAVAVLMLCAMFCAACHCAVVAVRVIWSKTRNAHRL